MSGPEPDSPPDARAEVESPDLEAAGSDRGPAKRRSGQRRFLLAALTILVSLLVAATHWPALSAQALALDDGKHVLDCPMVQNPSLGSARRLLGEVFTPSVGGYYKPLSMISLMLDRARADGPDDVAPFRQTSLALHVMCTALVVVLLYQLFGQPWGAAFVGLLFGVHPVTVEAIPWMAERKALLTAFFALWCLVFYVRYAHRGGRRWYAASLVLYFLAVMAKPTATPLAVLLLLLDYWPLHRLSKRAVVEKIPFFVVAGVFAVITVISQHNTIGIKDPTTGPPLQAPLVLAHNIVFYLVKIVWPGELTPHYPYPKPLALSHPMVLAGVIGSILLIVALLVSWRYTRALVVGWLFFFIAIFPAIGVITFMESIAADRFLYFPAVGLMLTLTWLLARLWKAGAPGPRLAARRVGLVVVVLLLATAEARATRRYLASWQDTLTLAQRMVALAPRDSVVYGHLGLALAKVGRTEEAIEAYKEAIRLKPRDAISYYNVGALLDSQGKVQEAAQHYRDAVRLDPDSHAAHTALGKSLQFAGRLEEAVEHYRQALRANPDFAEAHNALGVAMLGQGLADQAIEHCRAALRVQPDHPQASMNLARALAHLGKTAAAMDAFQRALRVNPDDPEVHCQLGAALSNQGKTYEGVKQYKEALRLDPDYLPAHLALANVLRGQGRLDQAAVHLGEALRLQPHSAQLHNTMGTLKLRQDKLSEAATHFRAAVRCDPDYTAAHNNLGRVLARQKRWDQAIDAYREALRSDPARSAARINLAKALRATGQIDQALNTLRQAVQTDPQNVKAHLLLAELLEQKGLNDEALDHYRTVLRLDPYNAAAREALDGLLAAPGR